MKRIASIVALTAFAVSSAFAADAGERRFIREGMTEGEVLVKIGAPDTKTEDTGGGAKVAIKRWTYMPTTGDPQTITTIVLENGKVKEVVRQVVR
jgi:hypothetical protein